MAETIHVAGEGGTVFEMDLPLPDGVAQRLERGDIRRVNPDGSPYEEPAAGDNPPALSRPRQNKKAPARAGED